MSFILPHESAKSITEEKFRILLQAFHASLISIRALVQQKDASQFLDIEDHHGLEPTVPIIGVFMSPLSRLRLAIFILITLRKWKSWYEYACTIFQNLPAVL